MSFRGWQRASMRTLQVLQLQGPFSFVPPFRSMTPLPALICLTVWKVIDFHAVFVFSLRLLAGVSSVSFRCESQRLDRVVFVQQPAEFRVEVPFQLTRYKALQRGHVHVISKDVTVASVASETLDPSLLCLWPRRQAEAIHRAATRRWPARAPSLLLWPTTRDPWR